MKEELIRKIEKSNLSKHKKNELINALKEEVDYIKFLKLFYYLIGISKNLIDLFDLDLEQIKELFNELLE